MKAPDCDPGRTRGPGEVAPDINRLKAYTKAKHTVASEIRALKRLLAEAGDAKRASECQDLMAKLAEDRFTLAVLGQFKRGKSSLMNAILGRDLLPTGVLPLTSVITILRFGPRERLVIDRGRSTVFPEEAPVSQMASYVTEKGNPGNEKRIRSVCVEAPLPFLRQGLEFVDTPGVGSAIEANTLTTQGFLPQCDAAIFVTSVDAPLTMAEMDFFRQVAAHVRKVFLVVNKTDLLGDLDREEVMGYITKTIRQSGAERLSLYPVSSRDGLAAKRSGDQEAYARSGLKDLEQALADFLSSARALAFLIAVADKALRLLADEPGAGTPGTRETPAAAMKHRLERLLQQLQAGDLLALPSELPSLPPAPRPAKEPKALTDAGRESDLAADLSTRGCPVCQYVRHATFDFLAGWQNAFATDAATQESFASELGFCPSHTWQLVSVASGRGLSLGYPRLLERLSRELSQLAQSSGSGEAPLPFGLEDSTDCRACRVLREAEDAYVRRLSGFLGGEEGRRAYAKSQGVCARHLGMVLACRPGKETVSFLLSHAAKRLDECAEDMQRFAMKHDAIRRALVNSDEEDAYIRAIVHLVGEKDALLPQKKQA